MAPAFLAVLTWLRHTGELAWSHLTVQSSLQHRTLSYTLLHVCLVRSCSPYRDCHLSLLCIFLLKIFYHYSSDVKIFSIHILLALALETTEECFPY